MSDFLQKAKPYKKINIDGQLLRVEIVDTIPKEFKYVREYDGMGLFIHKTLFGDKNEYLLCKKVTQNNERNIK